MEVYPGGNQALRLKLNLHHYERMLIHLYSYLHDCHIQETMKPSFQMIYKLNQHGPTGGPHGTIIFLQKGSPFLIVQLIRLNKAKIIL